ncbi:hypothetical protein HPB50_018581 [Hyalomma asiaticum]|uniref:Uncharacterized protein n=1 Tax=Hyalomma asiaticum TaxID=266040 RepID=A0ACB7SX12_HYAAI|nr:hypothetical protein HPB50_018581 [Hyalomma asiaticum]
MFRNIAGDHNDILPDLTAVKTVRPVASLGVLIVTDHTRLSLKSALQKRQQRNRRAKGYDVGPDYVAGLPRILTWWGSSGRNSASDNVGAMNRSMRRNSTFMRRSLLMVHIHLTYQLQTKNYLLQRQDV